MPSSKSSSRVAPFVPDLSQKQAIEHVHGPMLVVAGAGTGKTSVLTHRIEHLVREGHAHPDEILALTYTVNAADEMRERVRKLLGGRVVQAGHSTTIASICSSGFTKTSAFWMRKISGFTCDVAFANFVSSTSSVPPTSASFSTICSNS